MARCLLWVVRCVEDALCLLIPASRLLAPDPTSCLFPVFPACLRLLACFPVQLSKWLAQLSLKAQAIQPTTSHNVPAPWREKIARVLITQRRIEQRVRQLSRAIERDYAGRDLVVISLLNGTVMFLADLIRHLSLPMRLDFIGISSYRDGTESRELVFTKELRLEVQGREVLLVDDILDTGKSLGQVVNKLRQLRPRRIRICVLLEKKARRTEPVRAHYVGFQIPDLFVVGYGLDFAERYRNLPFIGVLHPRQYQIG
jgi:hypoxanthine phosphoribosyltransferase